MRRVSRQVMAGGVKIGGDAPVTVQSMLKLPPREVEQNVEQALLLQQAGCDILRVAVPDGEAVTLLSALKERVDMPIVADIHFDWRLALESVAAGADKVRINPGNIGGQDRVREVAVACRSKKIPIRIGVNAGSVEKHLLARFGGPTAEAMAESALGHAALLEREGFEDIVLSIKSTEVHTTIAANRILAKRCQYPLHLGMTHTGPRELGRISSAVGIGSLLADGIGDTLRVSLTGKPEEEIRVGRDLLRVLGLGRPGPSIIACPTCGRCTNDIVAMTEQVSRGLEDCTLPITVAVMGCAVNGPGEAREADVAVIGSRDYCALYRKGKLVQKVPEGETIPALLELVHSLAEQREEG